MDSILAAVRACFACFRSSSLNLNGRQLNIMQLLGEGAFSYVYLVEDNTGEQYALKKIRCPFGAESVAIAMREVEASKMFAHSPLVISQVDSIVRQEPDGSRTVYLLLPHYPRGSLQDTINEAVVNGTALPEAELRKFVGGLCRALRVMHRHRVSGPVIQSDFATSDEQDALLDSEGRENQHTDGAMQLGEMVPWAHRDVKPANVMLDGQDRAVLMDMGSAAPARVTVRTKQQALELQDLASELCTLPYRAPELVDVRDGSEISEKVDIWSMGCTIFALMYGISPFEQQEQEAGASLNMAILNGGFKFPESPTYSEEIKEIVSNCLTVEPSLRPSVDDVLDQLEQSSGTSGARQ